MAEGLLDIIKNITGAAVSEKEVEKIKDMVYLIL